MEYLSFCPGHKRLGDVVKYVGAWVRNFKNIFILVLFELSSLWLVIINMKIPQISLDECFKCHNISYTTSCSKVIQIKIYVCRSWNHFLVFVSGRWAKG